MEDVGINYVHFDNFPAIWHTLWPFGYIFPRFGTFLPVLVCCTKKNLATLPGTDVMILKYFRPKNGRKKFAFFQTTAA
jgi:hypothetical protein